MSSDFQRIGGQLGGPASPFNKNASPFKNNATAGFEGAGIDGNIARALISASLRLDSNDATRENVPLTFPAHEAALFRLDSEVRAGICTRSLSKYLMNSGEATTKMLAHFKDPNTVRTDFKFTVEETKETVKFPAAVQNSNELMNAAKEVFALRDRRPDYEDQILTQMDGFWPYWTALTNICPVRCPFTAELMAAIAGSALNIVQDLKYQFSVPRPVDVIPGIMPMIRTPGHASYPSGHATLSHLEAYVLNFLLVIPGESLLNKMAARISKNREIAGVHYLSDSEAGEQLAKILFLDIRKVFESKGEITCVEFRALADAATKELNAQGYS